MLHELVRRGIGGRTVAEAACRLTLAELDDWADYAEYIKQLKKSLSKKKQTLIEW